MSDFFKFENREFEIPFVNHNPRVPKIGWAIMLFCILISFLLYLFANDPIIGGILFFAVPFIPLMYYLKWDFSAIIRKPSRKDVLLAFCLFVMYMIYGTVMCFVLESPVTGTDEAVTLQSMIGLIFSLMGEELIKFIPFLFLMRLSLKLSGNRKASLVLSAAIVMAFFGLLHTDFTTPSIILQGLLIQGLGTIFEFYGYFKTKNLLVPYMSHIFTDVFIYSLTFLGF
ncbi:MAG: hypothetical protein KIG63_00075 [Methanobrevibacter sp.]|uniref:CPBP family glutamic-type intramembrane protease n=1 Tax=Methanobrevibacter TaxID=2172 RepID=UPI0026F2F54C|nr:MULTISPECIES: CPBP family glutamic-type intramembrane protease [Methanobrevibacter]MBS7256828.1 hypothetical protein [Methanobrevibacter sp.]MDD6776842.1 hypothetical protein [Methanobacteriaceae archaeon]MDY3097528.1 hypothetical protein [Methanobrevibacter sp.]